MVGVRHLRPAVVARGDVDLFGCFAVLALVPCFFEFSLAGRGGEGRRLLEVEFWSGWMRRLLLWGVAACSLKIWPPQLRWSGAGPGSGAAGARGASPADGPSSSLHPVRPIWCLLRLIKAFEHGVLPFPGGVILAVVPFVVPDGGGLARQVISRL